ncbi:MAG: hypothetical protein M9898_04535 [Chitinophagaceae bacterium]|nr:hypothetical protein [Chitinophagaceae bacterium]
MQYIKGKDRNQCTLFSLFLDEIIDPAHDVRFIELFAESISLPAFAFVTKQSPEK